MHNSRESAGVASLCVQTALHYAAASTHGAICLELLVAEGANVNVKVSFSCQ